jgi:hypothetical protein
MLLVLPANQIAWLMKEHLNTRLRRLERAAVAWNRRS